MRVLVLVAFCSAVLACSASQEAGPDPDVTGGSGGQGGATTGGSGGVSTGGSGTGQDGPEVKTAQCQQTANGLVASADFSGKSNAELLQARAWHDITGPQVPSYPAGTTLLPMSPFLMTGGVVAVFCQEQIEVTFVVP